MLQLSNSSPPSRVDFLREAYVDRLSPASAIVLIWAIRWSSRRHYQTAWKAFTKFIHDTKPNVIDDKVVLSFMRSLFDERKFSPPTVATYKSALSKPLQWAFGLDLSKTVS